MAQEQNLMLPQDLELSGWVKNMLRQDVVMAIQNTRATFTTNGKLPCSVPKAEGLTEVGRLNGLFPLYRPAFQYSKADVARVLERMPDSICRRYRLWLGLGPNSKSRTVTYRLVSRVAAIVAYDGLRTLEDLLLPVNETRDGNVTLYGGFVPAWLLFQDGEARMKARSQI